MLAAHPQVRLAWPHRQLGHLPDQNLPAVSRAEYISGARGTAGRQGREELGTAVPTLLWEAEELLSIRLANQPGVGAP